MPTKTILITGATDGIGKAAAKLLAEDGHHLLLHGRDDTKLDLVKEEIARKTGNQQLDTYLADFSSLQQITDMGRKISSEQEELHVLINNAGLVSKGYEETIDGVELTFQVNYLSQFLLTHLLLPLLRDSAPARIVNVSSIGQATIQFDREAYRNNYNMMEAYNQSKLAVVLFTIELDKRLENSEITVNAVHPGTLLDTNLVDDAGLNVWGKPESGGEVLRYLATADEVKGISGEFFNEKSKAQAKPQAYGEQARELLWKMSKAMTKSYLTEEVE